MTEDFDRGKEIGRLIGEIQALNDMLTEHIKKQDDLYEKMDNRLRLCEQWIQNTTGKVVILTALFGIVGTATYMGINYFLNHWQK